jgi:tetratricopeptide (TPR) repeat protein
MSLLLQALQKAAKNRESVTPQPEAPVPPPAPEPAVSELPSSFELEEELGDELAPSEPELSLDDEDLFEPEEVPPPPAPAERFDPFAAPASSASAASILRASETPTAGWIDWVRDRPVHAFAAVAGLFMLFYGVYVYLQLFHPAVLRGDFLSRPLAATTPPPPARPITPPPSAAAPVPAPAPAPEAAPIAATAGGSALPSAAAPSAATPAAGPPAATQAAAPSAPDASPARAAAAPAKASEPAAEPMQRPAPRRTRKSADTTLAAAPSLENQLSRQPADPVETVSPAVAQAYRALQSGKLDQAETLYRAAAEAEPQNLDAVLGLATIAAQRGNAQQAIGFYDRALELEPHNAVALAGLISIIGQADPQLSESRLKQLIAREPSPFLYFSLGNLYAGQRAWASAQNAYFQAYQLQPDNPDYAYNLAIGLEHLNQPKLALTYYRKALDLSFQKGQSNFDQNRVIERIGQLSARVD